MLETLGDGDDCYHKNSHMLETVTDDCYNKNIVICQKQWEMIIVITKTQSYLETVADDDHCYNKNNHMLETEADDDVCYNKNQQSHLTNECDLLLL